MSYIGNGRFGKKSSRPRLYLPTSYEISQRILLRMSSEITDSRCAAPANRHRFQNRSPNPKRTTYRVLNGGPEQFILLSTPLRRQVASSFCTHRPVVPTVLQTSICQHRSRGRRLTSHSATILSVESRPRGQSIPAAYTPPREESEHCAQELLEEISEAGYPPWWSKRETLLHIPLLSHASIRRFKAARSRTPSPLRSSKPRRSRRSIENTKFMPSGTAMDSVPHCCVRQAGL